MTIFACVKPWLPISCLITHYSFINSHVPALDLDPTSLRASVLQETLIPFTIGLENAVVLCYLLLYIMWRSRVDPQCVKHELLQT